MPTAALFMLALPWAAPCPAEPIGSDSRSGALVVAVASAAGPTSEASDDLSNRPVPARSGGEPKDGDGGPNGWWRTAGALLLVGALIFAVRWLVRRGSPAGAGAKAGPMEVLARASVAPRQQILLVRLGKRLVLIGTGGGAMTTLAEVTDPAEVDELVESVHAAKGAGLAGLLGRYAKGGEKK